MRRRLAGLVACGLVAGCSFAPGASTVGTVAVSALVSFDACADVLDHLKTEARQRVGPYGLPAGDVGVFVAQDGAEALAQEDSATRSDAQSYSTTNVQEAGVDEPDIVKTDGRLIVTTTGSTLRVVDTTGAEPVEVGSLSLGPGEGVDATLLLSGDRALVIIRGSMVAYSSAPGMDIAYPGYGSSSTRVLAVDLSDPTAPTLDATLELTGDYVDARLVDGTVRLVLRSSPTISFPMTEEDWSGTIDEKALIERHRDTIAASSIEDWLPSYTLTTETDESTGLLVGCDQLSHPDEFAGYSTMSVLSLDVDALSTDHTVGVLTDGDTVYSSTDRLYVTTTRWGAPIPMLDGSTGSPADAIVRPTTDARTTGIHAFDITGDTARHVASGEVDGVTIGRYAMSVHDGVLRVATTTGDPWSGSSADSESAVVTLAERGGELVELGRIGGLGKTEQIYAVRYFGDVAYVVTFRQTDPLYVLDLSDPAEPALEGELKITGYSSYLHDAGDDRLLGIGQEATLDGMVIGTQISLFDVGDPAAPAKLDGIVEDGGWSDAEHDPHAFLYWPETGQLVVPLWAPESGRSGAMVLRVGDDTLTKQGYLPSAGPAETGHTPLLRSLVIGDTLYTVWDHGLQANALGDLALRSWLPMA